MKTSVRTAGPALAPVNPQGDPDLISRLVDLLDMSVTANSRTHPKGGRGRRGCSPYTKSQDGNLVATVHLERGLKREGRHLVWDVLASTRGRVSAIELLVVLTDVLAKISVSQGWSQKPTSLTSAISHQTSGNHSRCERRLPNRTANGEENRAQLGGQHSISIGCMAPPRPHGLG